MRKWTCDDCRAGRHDHDRYTADGSDAGCPRSTDGLTACDCRVVVHKGGDWRARAEAAEAKVAAVEALAAHYAEQCAAGVVGYVGFADEIRTALETKP